MTKQTQAHKEPEEIRPTAEELLKRFKMMDEVAQAVRKANIDAGLDPKLMSYYIMYDSNDSPEKKKYLNWLKKVTNPKREGFVFNQVADLRARDLILEEELSEHEGKIFPYRRLDSLTKIKTSSDGKLWLSRQETWFGLDAAGQDQHVSVVDLDYYKKPAVVYERVPKDPQVPDGPSIRVGKILTHLVYTAEQPANKTYLTPYSPERVHEFLKYAGPLDNHRSDGTRLILEKEGITNPVSATLDQFLAEDFDGTFDRIRTPTPNFEDFYKDYKKRAKEVADENNHQYG